MTYDLTAHGKTELENELVDLRKEYEDVVARVAEARSQGDLSENAEYENAREEQRKVQDRIDEIENILDDTKIIQGSNKDEVGLGSTVLLSGGVRYEIVGSLEASPLDGKISNESPLGEELIGKKVGETVKVEAPKGNKFYTVEKIS
ncbi:MAG: transcription elongation factor GreA [Candidatus Nomurabacteria bacterium]|jgi:transcription elongation factor GreA|nr:transcription elongation factor GreA [Candidatus Nomurabacteria bacterium]